MVRPRMNRVLPRYASEFIDNRGKPRIRLRRRGWATAYVQAAPGTPEFTEAYRAWERDGRIEVGAARVAPRSFDDLIARFYRSKEFTDIRASTQYTYRGELERFRATYGARSAVTMNAQHISNLLAKMADTPSAANNLRKRLSQLFRLAVNLGWRIDNPALSVRSLRIRSGGYKTWQEEQIEQFEAHWPQGTMPRLAFDLALYTAQRRSDVRVMGPQHVENGKIRVRQLKTGKTLYIPIHPALAASIAATASSGHLAFLVSKRGEPFSFKSFGMWFLRQTRAAGIDGYSMHGLRKAASRRMAEIGLSNQLIKSITGHSSDAEVSRYTRDAEQVKMADLAVSLLASAQNPAMASNPQGTANAG